jgi:hypothetical protein
VPHRGSDTLEVQARSIPCLAERDEVHGAPAIFDKFVQTMLVSELEPKPET